MPTNPAAGFLSPKNKTDQRVFNSSCAKNTLYAIFLFILVRLFQIRYRETPIKKYNRVHTGPKSQLGGLKNGLFKVMYQLFIAEIVKSDPTIPAPSQATIAVTSCATFVNALIHTLYLFPRRKEVL